MSDRLPLAPDGVFATVQGEGLLMGEPTVFVRLGGCSVGCPGCDTDYRVADRATPAEVARLAADVATPAASWAWVTGGEPTDHAPLLPALFAELRRAGFRVALATSGVRAFGPTGRAAGGPDFVSVSPHRLDPSWVVRRGDQVNVVPGLNGLTLADLDAAPADWFAGFPTRFVTPAWGADPVPVIDWVMRRPGWRVGHQAHKHWGVK